MVLGRSKSKVIPFSDAKAPIHAVGPPSRFVPGLPLAAQVMSAVEKIY